MKNNLAISVIGGLSAALLFSSFAFPEIQEKKNVRHIKLTKIENGKTMELDTVLSGDDIFVWNGDTIRPEKHIKGFSPSEFDKHHPIDVEKGKQQRRIYKHLGGKEDELIMRSDSGEDIRIITEDGDTTGKKIIIHKRMKNGEDNDHFIYLDGSRHGQFPPMPPMPPMPGMKRFRGMHSANTIDLNDPNIVSFKKKKMSGDREKIEIIRKKADKTQDMNFDFDIDTAVDVPEPPMPPEMDMEMNDQDQGNLPDQESEVEKEIKVKPSNVK